MIARDAAQGEGRQRSVLALEHERGDLADGAHAKDRRLEAGSDRHGLALFAAVAVALGAGALAGARRHGH